MSAYMLDALTAIEIDCRRCDLHPGLKDMLGCGHPPTAESDTDRTGWRHGVSPLRSVPAYHMGYAGIEYDWDRCPRWEGERGTATLGGEPLLPTLLRARRYLEHGSLAGLIPPPWTSALVEGLDLIERLEQQRLADARKEASRGH